MSKVWKHSRAEGSALLLLLAIADFANDDGIAWPSIATLAEKARISERMAQRHVKLLSEMGELEVDYRIGRSSLYRVLTPVTDDTPPQSVTPVMGDGGGVSPMTPEPSLNHQERKSYGLTPQRSSRKRDELWDILAIELGEPGTASERGRRNKALKELREVGATPEEIRRRLGEYRKRWPKIDVTATALAANWTQLAGDGRGNPQPLTRLERLELLAAEREENAHEESSS